jgi:hypothetical protein
MKRLFLVAALFAGCDDSSSTPDAPPGTADAPPGTADAPPGTPDAMAPAPDAPASLVDAGPGVTIPETCSRACDRVTECFMEPPDPACIGECSADLADCTPAQVQEVYDCSGVPCGQLKSCIGAVACIQG